MPLQLSITGHISGKTLVVASTRGNQRTEAVANGQSVIGGGNAYIARSSR